MGTANGMTQTTKRHDIQVKEPNSVKIRTTTYTIPNIHDNLLFMADVVDATVTVAFTKNGAYRETDESIIKSTVKNQLDIQKKCTYSMHAIYTNHIYKNITIRTER